MADSDIKLNSVLPAVDNKDMDWWETLSEPQQSKFQAWLYMRYVSSVKGDADLAKFYVMSTNEAVNKRFNDVRKHPKLQYMLMAVASPGMGSVNHTWIAPPKRGKSDPNSKILASIYPDANEAELEIMARKNTDDDIKAYLMECGWSDKDIKAAFKGKIDE